MAANSDGKKLMDVHFRYADITISMNIVIVTFHVTFLTECLLNINQVHIFDLLYKGMSSTHA